jgi:hypothetical protein
MSGLDNSQPVTDESSLHAEEIHHEHHGERKQLTDAEGAALAASTAETEKPANQ